MVLSIGRKERENCATPLASPSIAKRGNSIQWLLCPSQADTMRQGHLVGAAPPYKCDQRGVLTKRSEKPVDSLGIRCYSVPPAQCKERCLIFFLNPRISASLMSCPSVNH